MIDILFEDKDIVVCMKPVGMDSEHELPAALGGEIYTVHRLDKGVGGVMVYARNKSAAADLSRQIQNGEMVKEYVAMVEGCPPESGDWEDLLFKDSRKNKVYVVNRKRAGVKEAKLTYRCLTAGARSLVRVRLHTGRSHQIRVQFASRGYPLVGDHKYGARSPEKEIALFSCNLRFILHGKTRTFSALPAWAENSEKITE
ncbi:MAG: RNA pseudouridine synthase [Ruminococcaceae bacterium]|nr:RNA pseudouridine synthase [Oscillospiraceae bacterium]